MQNVKPPKAGDGARGKERAEFRAPAGDRPADTFPIACLGSSAGGFQPLVAVIGEVPPDAGLAIVVVNHMRRSKTNLPEILTSHTSMPVELITAGLRIQPNHVYVSPPNCDLTLREGSFVLKPLSKKHGWPIVITVFLESLARAWKGKAIAAILSGLDSDGVEALRSVKAAGGITIAQKVETAEHPSMPKEALNSGCVDYELSPVEIGRQLGRIGQEEARRSSAPAQQEGAKQEPEDLFPIVGIGASAGGIEAVSLLLENLRPNPGMAFVLIQHLDPTHASQLSDILSRKSPMPVHEVDRALPVEVDHVYVMPPARNLTIEHGILRPVPRPEAAGRNLPVDEFLKSLAKDRQNAAFAIVMSGTGSDGTMGTRAIKAEGGITFAQHPASAKFDGMPRNAIASGTIDFVMSPPEIAGQLAELSNHSYLHDGPDELPDPAERTGRNLDRIFVRLRTATGIDFRHYKNNTILRRIKRRMALHGIEVFEDYSRMVERQPEEAGILAQDFLVNVTSFFREPEVYEAMREKVFPSWLEGRGADEPIRIWIPGCSTGEEAYSVAIALTEFLEDHNANTGFQIFATDLSESVIEKARNGIYLESELAGVSARRLERFFVKRDRLYQVSQTIRDVCVFARQDVTKDPPFSRMDLISCCNLLIYLGPVLQKKVLTVFHYALKSEGFLVLGSSESVGIFSENFETVDRKAKIFARKGGSARGNFDMGGGAALSGLNVPRLSGESAAPVNSIQREAERMLLAEYAPASVIVDESLHVIQVRGQSDPYLQVPQGSPTTALTAMVRPGLLAALKNLLEDTRRTDMPASQKGLRVKDDNRYRLVDLRVSPIRGAYNKTRCFLVLFEDSQERPQPEARPARDTAGAGTSDPETVERLQQDIARLEQELAGTRDYLQSIIETQEASAEELRSANEEAQANNEELDTAKEELQASNEELNTVNEELRIRNAEQNSLNSDLRKLLESINVPLVMVGNDLRIRWFTAAMEPVLNLLPNDQGRPITDLRSTLIPDFVELLVRALAGDEARSVEFQHPKGGWLSLRILPYRGHDNSIDGAIATLIDIDDLKRARDFAEAVVETVREPLIVLNADLRVRTANAAFYEIFQLQKEDTEGRLFYEVEKGPWSSPRVKQLLEDVLPRQSSLKNYEVEHHTEEYVGAKTMRLNAREIRQQDGERLILLAIDDITELRRSSEDLRRTNEDLKQFVYAASHDLKEPIRMIVAHTELLAARYGGQLDANARVSMGYAVEGALRLEALISGLREFWQLSERADRRTMVDTNEVLRQALLNLEVSLAETGGKITSDRLPSVMGSESVLIQLFQNLLANGLKYRSEAPPKIHVSVERQGAEWVFSFRDNGIGIDPKHGQQIFGVFKRLHPPDVYSGTGMGLAICQKIVERSGGRIWVESQVGEGSDFKFTLPG